MFHRPHHQRIAHVLTALDGSILRHFNCLFGGGTCIALRYGEFRESVDIDFLVSDLAGYRELRQRMTSATGIQSLQRADAMPLQTRSEIRADQYGIRTQVLMDGHAIKFEIVHEARITLDAPSLDENICGIGSLCEVDLAASKLLANSDRQADPGVFSRDLIDLAMMKLTKPNAKLALAKAQAAYGESVLRDLSKAIDRMKAQQEWLTRCIHAMHVTLPPALVWQNIKVLEKNLL
jgi:Nucleotidyl transferase AbiEii toxin, Type IV TA system